jgi:hypothetical protein
VERPTWVNAGLLNPAPEGFLSPRFPPKASRRGSAPLALRGVGEAKAGRSANPGRWCPASATRCRKALDLTTALPLVADI